MPIEPLVILELAALGLVSGFLAGLLGIGGGMMLVPFTSAILSARGIEAGLSVKMAIATSMAAILFTSMSSAWSHHRHGAVRWDIWRGLAPGIVLGGAITSLGIFALVKGAALALVFALFVAFSATQMLRNRKPQPSRQMPGTAGTLGAGTLIGMISGLVGAGGGFISVPFMTWCNVPIRNAVATSAALGFPIALANVLGFAIGGRTVTGLPPYSLGYVWLPALVVLASCSVLMAPLGARAAHTWPVSQLKRLFAAMLYAMAAYMLYKGLSTL